MATNQEIIAWTLLASGIVFNLGYVFLDLMFSIRTSPWGLMNDIATIVGFILLLLFLFAYFNIGKNAQPYPAWVSLLFAGGGIELIAYTQIGLVLHRIDFAFNLGQGAVGAGLVGFAFIVNYWIGAILGIIPTQLNWLGLAAGLLMSMGLPTGLFYGNVELKMATGKLYWKTTSRLAIGVVIAVFVGQFVPAVNVLLEGIYFI